MIRQLYLTDWVYGNDDGYFSDAAVAGRRFDGGYGDAAERGDG